jgi:uncharacterized protein (DUF849 family)
VAVQLAVNGSRTRREHAAVPLTAREIAADAAAAWEAGARSVHVHPRDEQGAPILDPAVMDRVLQEIRSRSAIAVGMTTEQSIVPDIDARLAMLGRWPAVDFASVNVAEPGWRRVAEVLLDKGIGIEAGVWSERDVAELAASGFADRVLRVLVEPFESGTGDVLRRIAAIHARLDREGIPAPRLQHTEDASAWDAITDAVRRGHDTRVGLEDTLTLPDGTLAPDNAALVRAAITLAGQESRI